jgi:hypothetical protein
VDENVFSKLRGNTSVSGMITIPPSIIKCSLVTTNSLLFYFPSPSLEVLQLKEALGVTNYILIVQSLPL